MGASECLYHSQGRECRLDGLPGKRSRDAFPVTPYHTLIIPKRHVLDYFGLKQPEINAINLIARLLIGGSRPGVDARERQLSVIPVAPRKRFKLQPHQQAF
jgi:HIT domain